MERSSQLDHIANTQLGHHQERSSSEIEGLSDAGYITSTTNPSHSVTRAALLSNQIEKA